MKSRKTSLKLDRATQHAIEVINDTSKRWGSLHKLACQRHLDDLEKAKFDEFPYYWSLDSAIELWNFAEKLTISEGFEKVPVRLKPFQAFILGVRRGWKYKERYKRDGKWINSGERAHKKRFRRSYLSMAKQNGKTFINGIEGTNIAGFSGYHDGLLCCAATKQPQAKLAWKEMAKFIRADEDLGEFFEVKDYNSTIICPKTNCIIEAVSRERAIDEGFRYIFSSVDEIHQHKDNKVYQNIYNSTRRLPETLVSMVTTRGDRLNSFCYEMDSYCVSILNGSAKAEDFFVDIYCLDKGDDYFDEECWGKANPFAFDSESGRESIRTDAETAKDMGGTTLRDFIIKSLNLWCKNTEDQYINPDNWKSCGSKKKLEDFRGKSCYVGLDLSSGGDLTTLHLEFEKENGGYYWYSHSFMPRGRLQEHIETDLAPYDLWEEMGLITVTGDSGAYKNDYSFIIKHLKELQERYDLVYDGIGYDPHNADGFLNDLEEFGCPLLMITQSARFLNDGTVDVQLLVKSNQIEYDEDNELLTYSICNAKVVKNSFGEIKIDKEPRALTKRIDPADAGIDAHIARMKLASDKPVDMDKHLDDYFAMFGD